MKDATLQLNRPIERVLREGHPWVYAEAVSGERPEPGAVVTVLSRDGRFCARGLADAGPIAVRAWTTRDEAVDDALVRRRLRRALELREILSLEATDAYRLVHGEGDRLPGVVVDRYGDTAVLRLDGAGATAWRDRLVPLVEAELDRLGIGTLLVRTGRKETLEVRVARGAAPSAPVTVTEHGMRLLVDLERGQKTGLFLDHRESRRLARSLAAGSRVLNLYSYTGGFSVAAGLGGAVHVTTVDVAPGAIALAGRSWEANGLAPEAHEAIAADVPTFLAARGGAPFDLIIADPPSFAPNEKSKERALASYAALHEACLGRLAPGGLYLAASCSSHVDRDAFEETLREGARRARRVLAVLGRWGPPADHPRLLAFPEGDYLKVVLCRAVE